MSKSNIEWTESTWNPVTERDKASKGCKFDYAETHMKRLREINNLKINKY